MAEVPPVSDGIAAIRPALREMVDGNREQPRRPDGSGGWCADFSVKPNDNHWVQVVSDAVNFYYPDTDDPLARLTALGAPIPPGRSDVIREGGKFATLRFATLDLNAAAKFVDWLFASFYGLGPDYPLDVQHYQLM